MADSLFEAHYRAALDIREIWKVYFADYEAPTPWRCCTDLADHAEEILRGEAELDRYVPEPVIEAPQTDECEYSCED